MIPLQWLGNVGTQPTSPHKAGLLGARLLMEEGVYALRFNEHLKPRAIIESWLARIVERKALMEGRMTEARAGPVKDPLQRRLAPPLQ